MRIAMRVVLIGDVVLGSGGVGHRCFAAENPRAIVSGPTARKTGENWTISFEVGRTCDVTVRVVDNQGNVVRHLASGMVGLRVAAKPFEPNSLSQSIAWDGTDHAGNKLTATDYKAVVTVGISAKFDEFIIDMSSAPVWKMLPGAYLLKWLDGLELANSLHEPPNIRDYPPTRSVAAKLRWAASRIRIVPLTGADNV